MTRSLKGRIINETKFSFPFRMILAGSSQSGKTFFAGQLLKDDLFTEKIESVIYFYPCYLTDVPVDWHKTLDVPVTYQVGLPSKEDLTSLPPRTCVVIDDSFDEAVKSSAIDHLFRVISGKKNICVIIMTQNNFTKGKYGREIRNSCNYSVLFRNCCDTSINENIARMAGLSRAYAAAKTEIETVKYPYVFIDQSQQGQLSKYRLYTNIFGRFMETWSVDGMKGYVIGANDFHTIFKVIFEDSENFRANEDSKIRQSESKTKSRIEKSSRTQVDNAERESSSSSESSASGNEQYEFGDLYSRYYPEYRKRSGKHLQSHKKLSKF